jgi:hypothetical protein
MPKDTRIFKETKRGGETTNKGIKIYMKSLVLISIEVPLHHVSIRLF